VHAVAAAQQELGGGYDNAVVKSLRLGSDLGHQGGGRERRDLKQVGVGGSAGAGVDEVVTAVPPAADRAAGRHTAPLRS
jgi:hypothetical protein